MADASCSVRRAQLLDHVSNPSVYCPMIENYFPHVELYWKLMLPTAFLSFFLRPLRFGFTLIGSTALCFLVGTLICFQDVGFFTDCHP